MENHPGLEKDEDNEYIEKVEKNEEV